MYCRASFLPGKKTFGSDDFKILISLSYSNETEADSKCLALALDSHKETKTLELKIIRNCTSGSGKVCYQQAAEVTEGMKCDGESKRTRKMMLLKSNLFSFLPASHRTAAIVCKSKNSGWYPKAFRLLQKGFCDFFNPVSVVELNTGNATETIQTIIGKIFKLVGRRKKNQILNPQTIPARNASITRSQSNATPFDAHLENV